mgnify:CR=1 FL=1
MATITIAQVDKIKEGVSKDKKTQADRPWTLRKITFKETLKIFEQDGTPHEFNSGSTFDDIPLQPGQVIEAECSLDDEKKYLNLKKIFIIGATPQPEQDKPSPNQKQPKPQQQPQQSKDDQISEAVAFKGVIDLLCAKVIDPKSPEAQGAMQFINRHLPVKVAQSAAGPSKPTLAEKAKEIFKAEPVSDEIVEHFENVGAMFQKAQLDGITRTAILTKFNIKEKDAPRINPDDLWPQIYSEMIVPARKLAEELNKGERNGK